MDPDEPFPAEAARDLLGIVRAMHRAMRARGAGRAELLRVERVGAKLVNAIECSQKQGPYYQRRAHINANDAIVDLGNIWETVTYARELLEGARSGVMAGPRRRKRA